MELGIRVISINILLEHWSILPEHVFRPACFLHYRLLLLSSLLLEQNNIVLFCLVGFLEILYLLLVLFFKFGGFFEGLGPVCGLVLMEICHRLHHLVQIGLSLFGEVIGAIHPFFEMNHKL